MRLFCIILALACALSAETKSAFQISIEPTAPLKADVDVPFQITVKDAKGAPVAGAEVHVVATMVDMDHGEFKSDARQTGPGVYETKQNFLMGGAWNLSVRAAKGKSAATFNRKIEVKD